MTPHGMKRYNHYSFDLWGTLIKSNPQFKKERAKYLFENHNPTGLKLEDIELIINDVALMCNTSNEVTRQCILPMQAYAMVFQQMGHVGFTEEDLIKSVTRINSLFFKYHPTYYSNDTIPVLEELKKGGARMSILSNTGYMSGEIMRGILTILNMINFFNFTLFSDELLVSKPSRLAFSAVDNRVTHSFTNGKSNVLHVGDSHLCDGVGATNFGYDSFIVHSNKNTLIDLIQ